MDTSPENTTHFRVEIYLISPNLNLKLDSQPQHFSGFSLTHTKTHCACQNSNIYLIIYIVKNQIDFKFLNIESKCHKTFFSKLDARNRIVKSQ